MCVGIICAELGLLVHFDPDNGGPITATLTEPLALGVAIIGGFVFAIFGAVILLIGLRQDGLSPFRKSQ